MRAEEAAGLSNVLCAIRYEGGKLWLYSIDGPKLAIYQLDNIFMLVNPDVAHSYRDWEPGNEEPRVRVGEA